MNQHPLWKRVVAQVRVSDLATQHTQVRPSGNGRSVCRCLCGRNTDRRPSFMLYEAQNTFHCFACQAHGNPVHLHLLISRRLTRDQISREIFLEGARELAALYGISGGAGPITQITTLSAAPRERGEIPASARAALEAATGVYQTALHATPSVRAWLTTTGAVQVPWSRAPVAGRGLSEATLAALRIGYASGEGLARELWRAGIALADAQAAGLLSADARRLERLRERVVFPVLADDARPVYLMGRALVPSDFAPKFMGLADGAVYKQPMRAGDIAHGAIWFEGCFDFAALVQWGYHAQRGLIGLLGTAHEVALSHIPNLTAPAATPDWIALDQDVAGKTSALKLAEALAKRGRAARIVIDLDRRATAEAELDTRILARPHIGVHWGGDGDSPGKLVQLGEAGRAMFEQVLTTKEESELTNQIRSVRGEAL